MSFQRQQELLDAKLSHYNAWLTDKSRDLTSRYPGFPFQHELDVLCGCADPIVEPAPRKTRQPKAVGGKTKLEQAKELIASNRTMSRGEIIALFQTNLGMSKAGATTYWYSAQK